MSTDDNPYDPVTQTMQAALHEVKQGRLSLGDYAWVEQAEQGQPNGEFLTPATVIMDFFGTLLSNYFSS